MKIFIEPNDVLMFRDGKPFSGGDDHYARGIFPPFPSTFYGAIRSKILSEIYPQYESYKEGKIPEEVKKEIGTPSVHGSLYVNSFLIARRINGIVHPVFPVPKDIVNIKGREEDRFILKPEERLSDRIKSNFPFSSLTPLWIKSERPMEDINGFLSMEMMNKYLHEDVPDDIIKVDEIYQKDERVGIGKDRVRKTAATGLLYSVEYLRLKEDVGFLIELNGAKSLPKEGLLRLGGDHRSAFYRETSFAMPDMEMVKQKIKDSKRFKVILLTPAIFNNGWIPDWLDNKSGEGEIKGIFLRLVSSVIGKPVHVGGFDLVNRRPKEMKKAVPPGSVYYFELKNGSMDEVFNTFWLKSISTEKQNEGFGITFIGGY